MHYLVNSKYLLISKDLLVFVNFNLSIFLNPESPKFQLHPLFNNIYYFTLLRKNDILCSNLL